MTGKKNISVEEMKTALLEMGEKARFAARKLSVMPTQIKNDFLKTMADAIEESSEEIKNANAKDIGAAKRKGLSKAMLDRLKLNDERIKAMADGLRELTALEDPVGKKLSTSIRPNGLKIEKVSVPIGVIGIVYESRPNVTVDAAGLCLKAGNAVILRGGSESINSNLALSHCLNVAGISAGLSDGAVQLIPWTDRNAVNIMLKMDQYIDLVIPRGGESLIKAVVENSTIPIIKHYKGICHLYVDSECDMQMALKVVENAKCQRPGVCNAIETLLVNNSIVENFAPEIAAVFKENGVEIRADKIFRKYVPDALPATKEDWNEEYLDLIISVAVVQNVEEAIEHINTWSSAHSDGIITENARTAGKFLNEVDSSTVYWNASTRFTDGGEFGMGAEIGISTDKLHARGPMGLSELTTYKYLVTGNGQIRP
jgi:glutamate-5-semialdehyde dehydrogenase